jgi:hypothetical protein
MVQQVNTVPRFSYQKRLFLAPPSSRVTSFVFAEVQDSLNGEEIYGENYLVIADCDRRIKFEFFLGTRLARRFSLAKIDLLIAVLSEFRKALKREIRLIEKAK